MIVYFSGTGNSRFAAEYLAAKLKDEILDAGQQIRTGERGTLVSDRPWIFVAPIYAWRMPRIFYDYLSQTRFEGNNNAYFILTCGGDMGNADRFAAELCGKINLQYHGTLELVMPDNYIIMFRAPEAAEAHNIITKAKPALDAAAEQIKQKEDFPARKAGFLDKVKSGAINEGFYKMYVKADAFYSTNACTGCGVCVARCPLNNMKLTDKKVTWGTQCTHCMACICGCPVQAIEYGKKSRGKTRYQCPKDELL